MEPEINPVIFNLYKLAGLPEKDFNSVHLHGNLSLSKKNSFFNSLFSKKTEQTNFSQIQEFTQAVNTLETEIRRTDYALLRDVELRDCLPYALRNLRKMAWKLLTFEEANGVRKKIDSLRSLILSHVPLSLNEKGPVLNPYFNKFIVVMDFRDEILPFQMRQEHAVCLDFLLSEISSKSDERTDPEFLDILYRLDAWSHGNRKDEIDVLIYKTTVNLFNLPVLRADQRGFLEFIYVTSESSRYRADSFDGYILSNLEQCVESYDSPKDKLSTFHSLCQVGQRFKNFRLSEKPLSDPFESRKQDLLRKLLPHLPNLIEDQEAKEMLKGICLFVDTMGSMQSQLFLLIMRISDYNPDPKQEKLKIDELHQTGFLVKKTGTISDGWKKIVKELIPNPSHFVKFAFLPFESFPSDHPKRMYYMSFIKGPDLLDYPRYFLLMALHSEDTAVSDVLIPRLAQLNPLPQSFRMAFSTLFSSFNYVKLLLAAKEANNSDLMEICFEVLEDWLISYLISSLDEQDKSKPKPIFDIPDEIFFTLVRDLDATKLHAKVPERVCIDVTQFPKLTYEGLNILIQKFPEIEVVNFDCSQNSPLSDCTLSDLKNTLFFNSAILKRSSDYFEAMLGGSFKESYSNQDIVLDQEQFSFFKTWLEVFFKPSSNFYKTNLANFSELYKQVKGTPFTYLSHLNFALFYQMNSLYQLLDRVFTVLISAKGEENETASMIQHEIELFRKLVLKFKSKHMIKLLEQIQESQFFLTLDIHLSHN